jgi:L-asparaginase
MSRSEREASVDKNAKKKIIMITTGGTIDKSYDEFDGTISNRESLIKTHILDHLRLPHTEIEIISLFAKDSLHFTDFDRSYLTKSVMAQSDKGHPVVVLHGTDTMVKSAELIYSLLAEPKAPVIFTGAMKPLGFIDSDAFQNVVEALTTAHFVSAGIYISFHMKLYKLPEGVRKNIEKKTFECF